MKINKRNSNTTDFFFLSNCHCKRNIIFMQTQTIGKKSRSEKEQISKPKRTIKKEERPTTKTSQKVLPKTKSLIQVRVNYVSKNNRDKETKRRNRNQESLENRRDFSFHGDFYFS